MKKLNKLLFFMFVYFFNILTANAEWTIKNKYDILDTSIVKDVKYFGISEDNKSIFITTNQDTSLRIYDFDKGNELFI